MSDQLEQDLLNTFSGTMYKASSEFWHTDILPTGISSIDYALGRGFGYGRLSEIYGDWSSGKTMLLYYALANNQRMLSKKGTPGRSILFESEGAFTPEFYKLLGGDPETLLVYPVDTVEEVFDGISKVCKFMQKYVKSGDNVPVAIGWDSIAATGTRHLLDTGMTKRDLSKAVMLSAGTQLITTEVKATRIAVIATNQIREKIGSMSSTTHTPGGKAWPFHSSQRIELRFSGTDKASMIWDKTGTYEIGRWVKGNVTKNKLATPFGKFLLSIYIRETLHPLYEVPVTIGIYQDEALFWSYTEQYIRTKSDQPIIVKTGGWYELNKDLFPQSTKFRASQWLHILKEYPQLRNLEEVRR